MTEYRPAYRQTLPLSLERFREQLEELRRGLAYATHHGGRSRDAIRCAVCAGEGGRPGVLASLTSLPPEELRLVDVSLVGSYGLCLVWGSGHDTGIYTFEYLRSLSS